MSISFSEYLEDFTSLNKMQNVLRTTSESRQNFELTAHEMFELSNGIQLSFQLACVEIAQISESSYTDPRKRIKANAMIEKLTSRTALVIKENVLFKNNSKMTANDVAKSLIQDVFIPLSEATNQLAVKCKP